MPTAPSAPVEPAIAFDHVALLASAAEDVEEEEARCEAVSEAHSIHDHSCWRDSELARYLKGLIWGDRGAFVPFHVVRPYEMESATAERTARTLATAL